MISDESSLMNLAVWLDFCLRKAKLPDRRTLGSWWTAKVESASSEHASAMATKAACWSNGWWLSGATINSIIVSNTPSNFSLPAAVTAICRTRSDGSFMRSTSMRCMEASPMRPAKTAACARISEEGSFIKSFNHAWISFLPAISLSYSDSWPTAQMAWSLDIALYGSFAAWVRALKVVEPRFTRAVWALVRTLWSGCWNKWIKRAVVFLLKSARSIDAVWIDDGTCLSEGRMIL